MSEKRLTGEFVADIRAIILSARNAAVRSVDFERVRMYWRIGERIVVEEQAGKMRADYETFLLQNLAASIEAEFGSGFSYRQLAFCRQFYCAYPIMNALRSQFNWYQYRLLIQIDDANKREYYEHETLHNNWTGRELERQINSGLYERLLLSNDKMPDENSTIGILLCADKNSTLVKYTLPEHNNTILASKYQLYLPTEKQLAKQLRADLKALEQQTI